MHKSLCEAGRNREERALFFHFVSESTDTEDWLVFDKLRSSIVVLF